MHRRIIVAVLAVAAGAVFTIVATSGAQAPGPQTLVLKENQKGGTFAFIDQKPLSKHGRASVGDQLVFSNPLADTAGKPTGKLEVVCTDIKAGPADNGAGYLCRPSPT